MSTRTLIFAGVGLLVVAAAGAGAWFFLFEEEAPPPKVAASAPPKPAADTKGAPAGAPGAAKPTAEPAKAGEAPKAAAAPAAAAAKPAAPAKPIPKDPTQLINEVVASAGLRAYFQTFAREAMLGAGIDAGGAEDAKPRDLTAAEVRAATDAAERAFEASAFNAELAAALKSNLEVERMGRFLELLRQPVAEKMNAESRRSVAHELVLEQLENVRKNPLSAEKAKLIQELDEVTQTSEIGADMTGAIARDLIDGMLASIQKTSKNVPKETRQRLATQLNAMRAQARTQIRSVMAVMYRDASEAEIGEYLKLLDADTGRWASGLLANALRPMLVARGTALGREFAQIAIAGQARAKPKPAAEAVAKAESTEGAAPTAKPAAKAPAEPPAYRRAEGTRDLYARYNDVVTATVMRDGAAVKELLDDGKQPNARQADGMTALMVAAGNGDAEIALMLLAKGADPNLRTPDGATALTIAREQRRAALVQLLQKHGAKN